MRFLLWLFPLITVLSIVFQSPVAEVLSIEPKAVAVLGVAIWMIAWWISETIPLGIVALFPMVFFSALQITPLKKLAAFYSHPIVYLFVGGFMIAIALEKTKLSDRFALNIIKIMGSSVSGIVTGFIIATATLSMWISNTATTVMMVPIAAAVLTFIEENAEGGEKDFKNLGIVLMLCLAYSANIGGVMTPIGTPPNVVLMGLLREKGIQVNFFDWMLITAPIAIVLLTCMKLLIQKVLYPFDIKLQANVKSFLNKKIEDLGPMDRAQKTTLIIFICTCLLWILKNPLNKALGGNYFNDTLTAMMGGIACFAVPLSFRRRTFILDKGDIAKLPWNIILLFGGGLALANGMGEVGLIELAGNQLQELNISSEMTMILIISASFLFLTELMSNVALVNIALPVIIGFCLSQDLPVLKYVIPATLAASMAFSLPISTPPNVIVFSTGRLMIKHMIKAGVILNFITIAVIAIFSFFR